jgi:YHS domain-containing protein
MCNHHQPNSSDVAAESATTQLDDRLAPCPVMPGRVANKAKAEAAGLYREYDGNQYWLCCAPCGRRWDADPAKYAAA